MKLTYTHNNTCFIIAKTYGSLSFPSFRTIQLIIHKNKKLYQKVCFKKIPKLNQVISIKPTDIILEFFIVTNIKDILKVIKFITYKVSIKFKVLYLKK